MWVYPRFPGDENKVYNKVQHDLYKFTCIDVFEIAKSAWMKAAAIVGLSSETIDRVYSTHSIDHRTVQTAHDAIATCYRYENAHNNFDLGFDGKSHEEIFKFFKRNYINLEECNFNEIELPIAYDWYRYYLETLERFCSYHDEWWDNERKSFPSLVMVATVLKENSKRGSNS